MGDSEIRNLDDLKMNAFFDKQDYLDRVCGVCGQRDSALLFDQPIESIIGIGNIGYHHLINGCTSCGFTYASPILKEELILRYYENMSNYEHPVSNGIRPVSHQAQIQRQIEIIKSRFDNLFVGKALDIGCSIPLGLSILQKEGWKVLGLDPSDKCIAVAKQQLNVEVLKGFFSIDLLMKNSPYDLIILSHVLEHLVNPSQILNEISNLLSENGLLYVEVPDHMNISGVKSYFDFEHINYFTSVSLTNLIQQNGFEVDSLRTYQNSKEIHPNYPVISCTVRKQKTENVFQMINDFEETTKVIQEYKSLSKELMTRMDFYLKRIVNVTSSGKLALWGAVFTPVNSLVRPA